MKNKCVNIIFGFAIIIVILIMLYVCFKNKIENFSNIEMKNNLNDLDYLFDFKEFKKNMTEKCDNITLKQKELNVIIENECKDKNINSDLKCRKLQESDLHLNENKKNYCLFSNKNSNNNIEGFSNVEYYNYN